MDDFVEAWDAAIVLLLNGTFSDGFTVKDYGLPAPVGLSWRHRAAMHLTNRVQRILRVDLPMPLPSDEQAAMALIRGVADNLMTASTALGWAAARLKEKGDPNGASQTMRASLQARDHARALVGTG